MRLLFCHHVDGGEKERCKWESLPLLEDWVQAARGSIVVVAHMLCVVLRERALRLRFLFEVEVGR